MSSYMLNLVMFQMWGRDLSLGGAAGVDEAAMPWICPGFLFWFCCCTGPGLSMAQVCGQGLGLCPCSAAVVSGTLCTLGEDHGMFLLVRFLIGCLFPGLFTKESRVFCFSVLGGFHQYDFCSLTWCHLRYKGRVLLPQNLHGPLPSTLNSTEKLQISDYWPMEGLTLVHRTRKN